MITSDGYVSMIYRIPGKIEQIGQPIKKPAVLMQHGLLCDHMFWMVNDADLAPPFTLANQGYDVWLGNNRGNRFARGHTSLDTKDREFWETNFTDMGVKDVPAFIDFILAKTG